MANPVASTIECPQEESRLAAVAKITFTEELCWKTPGSVLADGVASMNEVRFVLEKVDPDRCTVFVILEDDPEPVLDRVFDVEQKLYTTFPKMPFDVRVMKPAVEWNAQGLLATTVSRYTRP